MTRTLLRQATEEVEAARDAAADDEQRSRLDTLAERLRLQADRDATPALGVLDRVYAKLGEIDAQTDEPAVSDHLDAAREHVLAFLETLDDRGMKQHGWTENAESNGSA